MTTKTATETTLDELGARSAAHTDARIVRDAMERFSYHWAPSEPRKQAEFQADLLLLIQAVHRDAARPFGDMLTKAMSVMPLMTWPSKP
jgi:hypothetical protein